MMLSAIMTPVATAGERELEFKELNTSTAVDTLLQDNPGLQRILGSPRTITLTGKCLSATEVLGAITCRRP